MAAADAMLRLERASGVEKGNNTSYACDALLTVADFWQRCSDRERARQALRKAREAYDTLPSDYPRAWYDSEIARIDGAIASGE